MNLELINQLRTSLKEAHNNRRNLLDELTAIKETNGAKAVTMHSNDLFDKNMKLAELTMKIRQSD